MICSIKTSEVNPMKYAIALTLLLTAYLSSNVLAQEPDATDSSAQPAEAVILKPQVEAEPERFSPPLTRYISDQFYVPLRETPCSRCKIVHRGIKSGTSLQLLSLKDGWALVLTDRGVEGWMEQQHLMDQPVARAQLVKDQAKLAKLQSRNNQLEQIMGELRQQSKSLRGQLSNTEGSKENLAKELATIKEISSDAIALNAQNQELVKQNHMLQAENDVLTANFDDLQKDKRNESFLYGGLTVFLGAILVVLIPKLRGRKRFSEWQ
jgi:SH3 domain protein